jgi:tetratricopeptide (TPR) repeat protein
MSAHGTQTRLYVMVLILIVVAAILPSAVRGEEKSDEKARTVQYLLRNTYLGHAAELPSLDEPVEVLQRYLGQGLHGSERPSVSREVTIWKRLTQRYPNSRYAYFGLGRAYRARFEKSKSTQDLQRAINAFSKASEMALSQGRIRYTRDLSVAIVQQGKSVKAAEQLDQVFGPLMDAGPGMAPKEFYLALVDYGDGLAALADERAWEHFERAIDLRPENNIEAINRYAKRLLERGRAREALEVLETRISRDERIRRVVPAYVRKEALARLGLDTSSADEEIEEIDRRTNGGVGALTAEAAKLAASIFSPVEYAHTNQTDDCRDATYAQRAVCTSYGKCYYPYLINLAEILWNEARGESWGQSDMVGWTVRNRALQGVSCDSYVGGINATSCRSNLPCGDPKGCDFSRWYCCVEHGGTFNVGTPHQQFNDTHVPMAWLEDAATITEAYEIINGRIPDPSTGFIPLNISGCNGRSCASFCTTGVNTHSPSPNGPMEYLGYDYCARRIAGTTQCKRYVANVCGDLPVPTTCSTTPRNHGDNHFWNRIN